VTSHLRSAERKNRIIKTFSVGLYAKIVSVIVSFSIVPLAVNYLGVEQYGLWVAVSSLIAILSFADGGVGNAMVNMISRATGIHSNDSMQKIVSTGYLVILVISLFGLAIFFIAYDLVSWSWMFGLSDQGDSEQLLLLVLIVGVSFFIGMPFSLVGNIQRGFQEGNIRAFWEAKGRLFSLLFVIFAIYMDLGLLGFALAFVFGPIFSAALNSIKYFFFTKRNLLPKFSLVSVGEAKEVFGVGGLFFILQITSSVQMRADNVIIANMLGPEYVAGYSICMQLFLAIPMILSLLWTPLWPAYREALASDDAQWVKRIFYKSMKLAMLVGIPISVALVIFGQKIIQLWVGDSVMPSMSLLIGCGIWMVMVIVGNALAVFLNGVQVIKTQVIISIFAAIFNVVLTIMLIPLIGVEGAVYGTVLSYFICAIIPYGFLLPNIFIRKVGISSVRIKGV